MRTPQRFLGWSLLLVVALGAGSLPVAAQSPVASPIGSPSPMASVDPSAAPSASREPSASPLPPPEVKLLDAGRKPRKPLRFRYTAGTAETFVIDMTQSATTAADGVPGAAVLLPTLRYTMSLVVTTGEADGSATTVTTVTAIDVLPREGVDQAVIDRLGAALTPLVGYQVTATIDTRGQSTNVSSQAPEGLDPAQVEQLDQVMGQANQLSTTLPEEPVGVGARWAIESSVELMGLRLGSRQVTTLRRVKGDILDLRTHGTQHSDPGSVDLAGVPEGYAATLVSLAGTSTLNQRVDLSRIEVTGGGGGTVSMSLSLTNGTDTHTSDTTVTTALTIAHPD